MSRCSAALLFLAALVGGARVSGAQEWYVPTDRICSTTDVSAARSVAIKTDKYYNASTMISPDSAKLTALCAVPGQIGSGEMNVADGRT